MTLKDIAKQLNTAVQTVPNLVQILRDGLEQATAGSTVEVTRIVSSGTKIASVKVDNETTDLYAPDVTGGINYSETEQDTGLKWYDGSTIYQRTYVTENVGSSNVVVDANMTLSAVDIIGYENNGMIMNSPYNGENFQIAIATNPSASLLRLFNSSSGLQCNIEGAGAGVTATVRFTVKYIKLSS